MIRRSREVNIFNMSLLDILCGALGAFCFMMLVLFPHWRPAGATAKDIEAQYQSVTKELEDLKKQLAQLPGGGDLSQKIDKIRREVNQQKSNADRMRKELDQAKREADDLRMRRPLTISIRWSTSGHDVDLYVRSKGKSEGGKGVPPADPERTQGVFFQGDAYVNCASGPCAEVWSVRDVGVGTEFEIYYKFLDAKGNPEPAQIVDAWIANHEGAFIRLPRISMPQPKAVRLIGILKLDPSGKLIFAPQPEYREQFDQLNKPEAPPPPPAGKK
ncbi:MAG: hypothetical protein U0Q16_21140 [Bryobacteraceae bacterium]